jgi:hypothetical protein
MILHFQAALDSIIKTVSNLPSEKFINKISKIVTDRKTDSTTIPLIAETLAYGHF